MPSISRTTKFLCVGAVAVIALGALVEILWIGLGMMQNLRVVFSLSEEWNVPTIFSSFLHGMIAYACYGLSQTHTEKKNWWLSISMLFVLTATDEIVQIHEQLSHYFHLDGVLYFGWVIPASIFVGILAMVYWPFLRSLPEGAQKHMTGAAVVFLFGAVGGDFFLGSWTEKFGSQSAGYFVIDWIEESLEIIGLVYFYGSLTSFFPARTGGDPPS